MIGKFGAARVVMLPASPGTGVIAGGAVRAVVQAAGITDILTKSYGSTNKLNLVKAAIDALTQLRTKDEIARLRGVPSNATARRPSRASTRHKKRKRVGRGIGSGHGKTSRKGHKGHSSRQGFKQNPLFEGGQMPLARRVPKRGFVNGAFKKDYAIVNLDDLEACFEAGAVVDEAALRARGLVKGRHDDGIKILGDGELTKAARPSTPPSSASRPPPRSPPPAGKAVVGLTRPGQSTEPRRRRPASATGRGRRAIGPIRPCPHGVRPRRPTSDRGLAVPIRCGTRGDDRRGQAATRSCSRSPNCSARS